MNDNLTQGERDKSADEESDAVERERLEWVEAEDRRLMERRERRERESGQKWGGQNSGRVMAEAEGATG